MIWVITKAISFVFWFLLGSWVNSTVGLWGLIPVVFAFGVFQVSDIWNQYLISKAAKLLKQQIQQEGLIGAEKKRNIASIQQIQAKRSLFSAVYYLLKRAGTGRKPKYLPKPELMDFAPAWVKKHILSLLIIIERYLNPMMLRANLPPIKEAIKSAWENERVFIGMGVGSGLGNFERVIAKWCHKAGIPAVIIALDIQPEIIQKALESMAGSKSYIVRHHAGGKVNTNLLAQEAIKSKKPITYLICEDARNIGELFAEKTIELTWFVRVRHHLPDWENVLSATEKISKSWIIQEEHRSWALLCTQYAVCWLLSRILLCDAEDSTLAYESLDEWREKDADVETHFPSIVWQYTGR